MKRQCKPWRNSAAQSRAEEDYLNFPCDRVRFAQNRQISVALILKLLVAAAILSIASVPQAAYSRTWLADSAAVPPELAAMEQRGDVIAQVREQVLVVLQNQNTCSAWFREADPDPAGVFGSLHFALEEQAPSYVFHMKDAQGKELFKHPWGARSHQDAGRNSIIGLNPSGPFFTSISPVIELDARGIRTRQGGNHTLSVGSFWGNTSGAQITLLLHELGHIVGRLPTDDDSWDGRSTQNTDELLRHCKHDIRMVAERSARSSH